MKWLIFIFLSINCFASDYITALDKSRDAFVIQSGISQEIQNFYSFSKEQSKLYAHKLNIEDELAFSLLAINLYQTKEIRFKLNSSKD